jgi:hypothetical protein
MLNLHQKFKPPLRVGMSRSDPETTCLGVSAMTSTPWGCGTAGDLGYGM